MIIALINWRIHPDKVDDFLAKWKTGLTLQGHSGLIGEFLSRVENGSFHDGVTWEMEPDELDDKAEWRADDFVSYVNVGMWENVADFMDAVGKYMSQGRTLKEDFEAAPRRRAILTPEHWRIGPSALPQTNSSGVIA